MCEKERGVCVSVRVAPSNSWWLVRSEANIWGVFFFSVPIGFSAVPPVSPGLFGGTSRAAGRQPRRLYLAGARASPAHHGPGGRRRGIRSCVVVLLMLW